MKPMNGASASTGRTYPILQPDARRRRAHVAVGRRAVAPGGRSLRLSRGEWQALALAGCADEDRRPGAVGAPAFGDALDLLARGGGRRAVVVRALVMRHAARPPRLA